MSSDPVLANLISTAEQQVQSGEIAAANATCDGMLRKYPGNAEALMMAAFVAAADRRFDRAAYLLERILGQDRAFAPAMYALGEVHFRAGRPGKALRELARGFEVEFGIPASTDPAQSWRILVSGVATIPIEGWAHRQQEIRIFGAAFCSSERTAGATDALLQHAAGVDVSGFREPENILRLGALLGLLSFNRQAPPDWNERVLQAVLLPWMRRALQAGRHGTAMCIEDSIYSGYVLQTETEEHFSRCFALWSEDMAAAGRRAAAGAVAKAPAADKARPLIGFFLHQLSTLAHARMLVDVIEAYQALPEREFDSCVFSLHRPDAAVAARLAASGIPTYSLDEAAYPAGAGFEARIEAVRTEAARAAIAAMVWVGPPTVLAYVFGSRIAPKQIWWATKYHGYQTPEIDGYVSGGSIAGGTARIAGRDWLVAPVAAEDWLASGLADQALSIRRGLSRPELVFGSFGREEKLQGAAFLGAIIRILKAAPNACFLWTGRNKLPDIQHAFEAAGVAERCHFIGWVDTKLYAQVIDVFLDSFPFPCGYTLYEAMAAGRPPVLFASPESDHTGLHVLLGGVLAGTEGTREDQAALQQIFRASGDNRLYLRATSVDEYVDFALRLAQNRDFRSEAGHAAAEFIRHFMSDRARVAKAYARHFVTILNGAPVAPASAKD